MMLHVSAHRVCMHILHLAPALVQLAPRAQHPRSVVWTHRQLPEPPCWGCLGGDRSSGMGRLIAYCLGCGPQVRGFFWGGSHWKGWDPRSCWHMALVQSWWPS